MKKQLARVVTLVTVLVVTGCWSTDDIVVKSLADLEDPLRGRGTLRSVLADADDGRALCFAGWLDGDTLELSIVGEEHSVLQGEVKRVREEEGGPASYLTGYFERDMGGPRYREVVTGSAIWGAEPGQRWPQCE